MNVYVDHKFFVIPHKFFVISHMFFVIPDHILKLYCHNFHAKKMFNGAVPVPAFGCDEA